jgi:hypothetical protein
MLLVVVDDNVGTMFVPPAFLIVLLVKIRRTSELAKLSAIIHAQRVRNPPSLPLAKAVPNRMITHPEIITGVIGSCRKTEPQIIPKVGMRNVTDAA